MKDKVPAGEYCVVATLCDCLGGSPLYWSKGRGPMGGGAHPATTPVSHQGRFFDIDLLVQQSIYMAAPPPETLRPSHVWIIELFLLSNRDDEAGADGEADVEEKACTLVEEDVFSCYAHSGAALAKASSPSRPSTATTTS